jgi:hypothetical protein
MLSEVASSSSNTITTAMGRNLMEACAVHVFQQKFILEDAIGSHACSLPLLA